MTPLQVALARAETAERERDEARAEIARLRAAHTLDAIAHEVCEWQRQVFTRATPASCAEHLRREAEELTRDPTDAEEAADVAFLLFGLCDRAGIDLPAAIAKKLAINRARTWGTPDAEGVVEHVREAPDLSALSLPELAKRAGLKLAASTARPSWAWEWDPEPRFGCAVYQNPEGWVAVSPFDFPARWFRGGLRTQAEAEAALRAWLEARVRERETDRG